MSRKKSSVNLPSDSPPEIEQPNVSSSQRSVKSWRRLVAKIHLNHFLTEEGADEQSDPEVSASKPNFYALRPIKTLLSKLRWGKTSSYDPVQLQRNILVDIGNELHQTRQEQGLSLEAIAADTLISVGLLKALEKGILDDLPEPIYIRGLIRKFADYLGLEGKVLASRFPTDVVVKSSQSSRLQIWFPTLQLRPLHLYFLYIAIVILSVEGISNHLKRTALELEAEGIYNSSRIESPSVKVSSSQNSSNSSQKTPEKPIIVGIQLKDDSWLKVVVDGKTAFEGTLTQGTHRTWMAEERLTVRASNADQVLIAFNHQQAKKLGKPGQVQEVIYQVKPSRNNN